MRLRTFHIDGFGVFCDRGLADIAPGLTVFQGANEAGKSTLLAFLRAVPYGFDRGVQRYGPLAGGNHGGWIEFTSQEGAVYRLERGPARKLSGEARLIDQASGEKLSEDVVTRLLGGTPREAYFNVYAFSIAELQQLESLTTEQVRARIWTAGLGLGDVSLVDVETEVRGRKEGTYTKRASKRPLNDTMRALRETRKSLRAAREQLDAYEQAKSAVGELEAEANRLDAERTEIGHALRRLEQYRSAWDTWVALRRGRQELATLDAVEQFPTDGVERLEALQERQQALAGEVGDISDQVAGLEKAASELEIDAALIENRDRIEAVTRMEQDLRKSLRDLPPVEGRARAEEAELAGELRDLGPDWDEDRLQTADISTPVTEAGGALGEKLREAEAALGRQEAEVVRAGRAAEVAAQRASELREALADLPSPPIADLDQLKQRLAALAGARQALGVWQAAQADAEHLADRRADLERQKSAAEARASEAGPALPGWVAPLVGLAGAVVVIAISRSPEAVAAALLLGIAIGGGLHWARLRLDRSAASGRERAAAEVAEIEQSLADTQRRAEEAETRSTAAREQLVEATGWPQAEITAQAHVENLAQELEGAREQLQQWREAESAVDQAERTAREGADELRRVEAERERMRESLNAARDEWRVWLEGRALRADMSPEAFREMVASIRRLREGLRNLGQTRDRVGGMRRDIQATAARAAEVWEACGRTVPALEDLPNALVDLSGELNESSDNAARAEALGRQIEGLRAKLKRTEEQVARIEGELKALLAQADAEDEEEFRRKGELHAERRALEESIAQGERDLELIAGVGEERLQLEAELAGINPAEIEPQINKTQEGLAALGSRLTEANRELGGRRKEIEQLESSAEIAELTQKQERLQAQLREQIDEYATLSAALFLVRKAREKYERERQPAVVAEAGRLMELISDGAYCRVVAPLGQEQLSLESADRNLKEIDQLSRGTQQQLYLAMRLAYVKVHHKAPGTEPLPLIMDEVLVNFDPERARRTAELILEVAQENQVFLFTCHPETTQLFRELDPEVAVVAVENGQIVPAG